MTTCTCGRPIGVVPHCPICGSSNVYAKDASSITLTDKASGETYVARGFRCRRCSNSFNEAEQCEAPLLEVHSTQVLLTTSDDLATLVAESKKGANTKYENNR